VKEVIILFRSDTSRFSGGTSQYLHMNYIPKSGWVLSIMSSLLQSSNLQLREAFDRWSDTLDLYRKRTDATVSVGFDFRSSLSIQTFEGSRLFAADAMGFQSTLVWKLLKGRVLAGRPSNLSSSI
jgi:hypothetical protein